MVALFQRPLRTRLKVAIIADATIGPFKKINQGSSLGRFTDELFSQKIHPYNMMWDRIARFYKLNNWSELSRQGLDFKCDQIAKDGGSGFIKPSYEFASSQAWFDKASVTPGQILEAAKRWDSFGWVNYEERKQDKLKGTGRILRWGALLGGGGILGVDLFGDL